MWSGNTTQASIWNGARGDLPNRVPQKVDSRHQQIRPAVQQIHSEEEFPTRNPIASILRHYGSMLGVGERRKALRFSALRVLGKSH